MFLEALSAALLGLALAWAAAHRLPHRLPAPLLVLPTGVAGALFGAFVTHTALGAGGSCRCCWVRRRSPRPRCRCCCAPRKAPPQFGDRLTGRPP